MSMTMSPDPLLLRSARTLAIASGLLAGLTPSAFAFDSAVVLDLIKRAQAKPRSPAPAGVAHAPAPPDPKEQSERLDTESEASFKLMSTCEGRFGSLRHTLERQVRRAEWISTAGGVIGVIGAVATCPHCAAFAAGLAGVANPLQQTFRDNSDTPQDTMAALTTLSQRIDKDIEAYRKLPPAVPGTDAFEPNLRTRLDALFAITASCAFYSDYSRTLPGQ